MPWSKQEAKWLTDTDVTQRREHTSFSDRGHKLVRGWADHCLENFELSLNIGYALDPDSGKRLFAIIEVSFNRGEAVGFSCDELKKMVQFFREHGEKFEANSKGDKDLERDYKEDLKGFVESLEYGIEQAQQFEPKNIN